MHWLFAVLDDPFRLALPEEEAEVVGQTDGGVCDHEVLLFYPQVTLRTDASLLVQVQRVLQRQRFEQGID